MSGSTLLKSIGSLAAAAALLAGCQTIPREPYRESVDRIVSSGSIETTIARLAEPLIAARRNIGMVVAVSTPEGEGIYAYGSKDLDGLVPMTTDAVFQVGSISKAFTAVLAAQLEQEHRLKVDDPVEKYLPADVDVREGLRHVTFAEMSSHSSGMPHESYELELLWGVITYLVTSDNLYRYYDTGSLFHFLSTYELEKPAVPKYGYSNIGVTYLGWLLGRIDGRGYGPLLKDKLLEPLGLKHTGLSLRGAGDYNFTTGYAGDLPTFVPRHTEVGPWLFDEGISGTGGIYSTAGDLLEFAKANVGLRPSPLFAAMQETHKPRVPAEGGSMGLAWFTKTLPRTRRHYTYIAGIIGGHTSFVGFDKERQVAVVVLQNSINHDDMIAEALLDRLVGAELVKADMRQDEVLKHALYSAPLKSQSSPTAL